MKIWYCFVLTKTRKLVIAGIRDLFDVERECAQWFLYDNWLLISFYIFLKPVLTRGERRDEFARTKKALLLSHSRLTLFNKFRNRTHKVLKPIQALPWVLGIFPPTTSSKFSPCTACFTASIPTAWLRFSALLMTSLATACDVALICKMFWSSTSFDLCAATANHDRLPWALKPLESAPT